MSEYKNIIGKGVRFVSSNLDNDQAEGQIWYNSSDGAFKNLLISEAWSSGGSLSLGRTLISQGSGTQTAALVCGGENSSGADVANTEEYNGIGFSNGGALPSAKKSSGAFGLQTAGVNFGGISPPSTGTLATTEEYNGSSWTSGGTMGTARQGSAGTGILTAGLACGGNTAFPGNTQVANTEEYDGSSWTNGGALNTARSTLAAMGTQTAGLAAAGTTNGSAIPTSTSEEYDGSSWTNSGSINTGRRLVAGSGIQTDGLIFGGFTPSPTTLNATEAYNGSSWTTSPATLSIASESKAGMGATGSASLATGGWNGTAVVTATEEYNKSTTVITAAAWASGGNINTARRVGASSRGGSVSGLIFGGDDVPLGAGNPQLAVTEEYDGSSWTNGGNIQNRISGTAGAGTQTAAIGATGYSFSNTPGVPNPSWATAGASYVSNAFEYDGSSWTNVTAYPTTAVGMMSLGTQTAALFGGGAQGGSPGPEANQKSKDYKEYDGTSWTTGGASNTFHSRSGATGGTQTAGVIYGGYDSPGGNPSNRSDKVEEYDGTSWTSALTAPKENALGGGFGTQTAFLACAGEDSPTPNSPGTAGFQFNTLIYDGTTMRTDVNTAVRRKVVGSDGSIGSAAGFVCGGATSYSARTTATEEYSQETSAINIKTITTS